MYKNITVRTENGKPSSLTESVRITFTLTPAGSKEDMHPYDPIARTICDFEVGGQCTARSRVGSGRWRLTLSFSKTKKRLALLGAQGKRCYSNNARAYRAPLSRGYFCQYKLKDQKMVYIEPSAKYVESPGDAVTLTDRWSQPAPHDGQMRSSMIVVNKSGSKKDISIMSRLAYHSLENNRSIIVPLSWELQAYVVNKNIDVDCILRPEDLRRPIFATPVSCDALPKSSIWTLCQDASGVIRLENDKYSHLGYPPSVPAQAPPTERTQFSQVLERLAAMEESITRIWEDVASGQRAIAGVQDQLSALGESVKTDVSGLNGSLTVIETRTAKLAESFDQSQTRLSAAQTATSSVQQLMTGLNKANDQLADLNRRVPVVESRYEKVAIALTRYDDRIDGVEKSANQTRDQVALVQQLAVSTNGHLMALAKQSPGAPAPDLPPPPAIESQAQNLEKSLVQTQKQLVSVRNLVYTLDRRIPTVELKADKLEIALKQFEGQTQADAVAVQTSLAGLDHRVAAMEARSGDVDFGGDGQDGGSPFTFPSYPAESPPPAGIPPL